MIDVETSDDLILVNKGKVFDGTRLQFSAKYMPNPTNDELIHWCVENGFSLSINKTKIL